MEPLQEFSVLVTPDEYSSLTEYCEQYGGLELVTRTARKRFKTFIKTIKADTSISEEAKKQLEEIVGISKGNRDAINKALTELESSSSKIDQLDNSVKNVISQFDSFTSLSSNLQSLSFVNIAASMADIAINVIGFRHVSSKIKHLEDEIEQLSTGVSNLLFQNQEELRQEFNKYIMRYRFYAKIIKDGDTVKYQDLEEYLLIDLSGFITKLVNLFKNKASNPQESQDCEFLLDMISGLLPVYTSALCIYLRLYYFAKKKEPDYTDYLQIYKNLDKDDFKTAIQNYLFLVKDLDYEDVVDYINLHLRTILFDSELNIFDQLELVKIWNNDEAYQALDEQLDKCVKNDLEKKIASSKNLSDKDKEASLAHLKDIA